MEKIGAIIFLIIAGLFCYATCKVASTADQWQPEDDDEEENEEE